LCTYIFYIPITNPSKNNIVIYKISKDVFNSFLQNNSHNYLKDNCYLKYEYPKDGEWFITHGNIRFPIQYNLINFIGNEIAVKDYISNNNISCDIDNMAIFNAPNTPITFWIKTKIENFYITINEYPEDDIYTYRFYNEKTFKEKFTGKDCAVIVNGKVLEDKSIAKLYYNYAELPLIAILKAFGATIITKDETEFSINFKNKTYQLNIKNHTFYNDENPDNNFLNQVDGGIISIYSTSSDLMVDDSTLSYVLYEMGKKVTITQGDGSVVLK